MATQEEKYQMVRDMWADNGYPEIADATGYSKEHVRKLGRKLGLPHKRVNSQAKERTEEGINLEALKKLIKNKRLSVVEVANAFNVCPNEAEEAIKRLQAKNVIVEIVNDTVKLSNDLAPTAEPVRIDHRKYGEDVFPIGFTADNHLGSKYERLDVLEALFDRFEDAGVRTVYQGGNMIDGEARFNKFDIYVHGANDQVRNFVEKWPRREGIVTEFVTGDDHEGWYVQREHVNIGQMIEDEARRQGREDLVHLGYMERDIEYHQPGGSSKIRIIHAGGGSSYATSYTSQKYVESLQGGEKPSIVLVGHFHKLEYCYPREVHVIQMGCTEDQTPFMRKKRIHANVGGGILWVRQNELGIFTSVKVEFFPFYDKKFYEYKW